LRLAIVMLMIDLFADGVVIWRLRVLCERQFAQAVLNAPIGILGLTAGECIEISDCPLFQDRHSAISPVSIGTTIGLRIATVVLGPGWDIPQKSLLSVAIGISQITSNVLSLSTSLIATTIVCVWAW
jgi:hypothetical protein